MGEHADEIHVGLACAEPAVDGAGDDGDEFDGLQHGDIIIKVACGKAHG